MADTADATLEDMPSNTDAAGEGATSRLERIMGARALSRLAEANVLVLGLGGVGSNCVEALARGGVGGLGLVDRDVVQPSNINRQAIAFHSTVGRRKVDVTAAMAADINPAVRVATFHEFVLAENLAELFAVASDAFGGRIDYMVDAIDTVSTKLAVAEFAQEAGVPLIAAMGAANKLRPECLRAADVFDTTNCPLCRVMRKECRKRGVKRLRVLYSCEEPVRVPSREGAARAERTNLGTASYMPAIMGQMIASEVIRDIAGLRGEGSAR